MTLPPFYAVLLGFSAVGVFLVTGILRRVLVQRSILDHPNARSSHSVPTPRGGGLAVIAMFVAVALFSFLLLPEVPLAATAVVLLTAGLGFVSWYDDVRSLPAWVRLLVHMGAVGIGLALLSPAAVFQGLLPPWLAFVIVFFLWVWFVNLFNFMDGIDGISGVETLCVCLGLVMVATVSENWMDAWLPLLLITCMTGFLLHNWYPARIFLGDVGSVPIGFLLGWMLLQTAARGYWAEALILPAYYLADATLTLGYRLIRREKVWEAHRQHYYQKAAHTLERHDVVCLVIAATNVLLLGCAAASLFFHSTQTALVCAAFVVFGGLRTLHRLADHPSLKRDSSLP